MLLTVAAFVVVIGVLVFVHELGHFVAAKLSGIHVHRFSLGLGAPIRWLSFTRGGTEYSISWLPLGGYVKMASREEDAMSTVLEGGAADREVSPERVFEAKPVWVRMIVILAGVLMNTLFAWALFSGLIYVRGIAVYPVTTVGGVRAGALPPAARDLARLQTGERIRRINGAPVASWRDVQRRFLEAAGDTLRIETDRHPALVLPIPKGSPARRQAAEALQPFVAPVIGQVLEGKPAQRAGLQVGDTILAIDGVEVTQWTDLVDRVESKPNQGVQLEIGRAGGRKVLSATPAPEPDRRRDSARTVGKLGIGPDFPEGREPVGLGPALLEGAQQTAYVSTQIVQIIRGMLTGRVSTRELGGPIAIGMAAGESARRGLDDFLTFMAAISVNLAILNLLPIPILDGGQFLFLLGEAVLRRPLSPKLRERLTMVGLGLILLLMVLAFSNDIRRWLGI